MPGSRWDTHVHVFNATAPVRPGHYLPAHRPLAEIEALAQRHRITRLVLVQPSVYGADNTVMLRALEASAGRHRGVAVVEPDVGAAPLDRLLDRLHAAGVRGLRINQVSPAGHRGDVAADLARLAPRLRERGWHLQWYARADELDRLARWQDEHRLPFVLDHLAGLHADLPADDPAWHAARALAEGGAWIKLSGWYRLGAAAPYQALQPNLQRAAGLFGARCLWGSDWPHTSFPPEQPPGYASTLAPLFEAFDPERCEAILREAAATLYDAQDPAAHGALAPLSPRTPLPLRGIPRDDVRNSESPP